MRFRRIGIIVGAWLMLLTAPYQGQAQENYPNRTIRIVIPYSPGSVTDVFARIIGQNMQEQWKGSIVVESKSGANGSIAAEEVSRAAPDGYTWLLVTTFFTASPSLNTTLRWDPVRDFIPIGQVCRAPGPGNDHLQTALYCCAGILSHPRWRPMRRNNQAFVRNVEPRQDRVGLPHGVPVRLAPHDDTHERTRVWHAAISP